MAEIDVADLYKTLGAVEATGAERSKQINKLFECVEDIKDSLHSIRKDMVAKEDIIDINNRMSMHVAGNDCVRLHDRLESLERDRNIIKGMALGGPPLLASIIEIGRWFLGKH